jgi:hypothetical protein
LKNIRNIGERKTTIFVIYNTTGDIETHGQKEFITEKADHELYINPEIQKLGTKTGFSIQLNDNDGQGKDAQINWGDGLYPKWLPDNFGVITFLE